MRGRQADRAPMRVWGVHAWDPAWVSSRHASYGPVIEAVRAHGDVVVDGGVGGGGFLLSAASAALMETRVMPADDWRIRETVAHTPKGDIISRHWQSTQGYMPLTREFYVKDEADLERALSIPYVPCAPDPSHYLRLREELGERALVMAGFLAPVSYLHELMGSERMAIWWATDRHLLLDALAVFSERTLEWLSRLLDAGVGPVLGSGGEEYSAPRAFSPEAFHQLVTLPGRRIGELIHSRGLIWHIHCHGSVSAILEDFVEMGCDVLHPLEPPPMGDVVLAEAKRRVGSDICIEGNIQIGDIYCAPTQALVEQVKDTLRDGAPGGGFILCPTASPYTEALPDQAVRNYLALIETGLEYGQY